MQNFISENLKLLHWKISDYLTGDAFILKHSLFWNSLLQMSVEDGSQYSWRYLLKSKNINLTC